MKIGLPILASFHHHHHHITSHRESEGRKGRNANSIPLSPDINFWLGLAGTACEH